MHTSYFGSCENPFNLTPDPRFLYLSDCHKAALDFLLSQIRDRAGLIVFTGGIGENAVEVREWVSSGLEFIGIKLDKKKNKEHTKGVGLISSSDSPVSVLVIPTNEELVIARETYNLVNKKK